jgi:hypothetical protein
MKDDRREIINSVTEGSTSDMRVVTDVSKEPTVFRKGERQNRCSTCRGPPTQRKGVTLR